MTLVALASAKGSPGVSTTAFAMAVCWPPERAVLLAEADPAGSALAPRFGLRYEQGVTSLAPASRHGFRRSYLDTHLQPLDVGAERSGVAALVGVRAPEQGRVLGRFWSEFSAEMAADAATDAIVDCGRLDPDSPATAVTADAQLTLLLTRPDVESVLQTTLRLRALDEMGRGKGSVAVVVVGSRPHRPAAVAEATGAEVLGVIAHDTRAAAVLGGERRNQRRLARSPLLRSVQALCAEVSRRLHPPDASSPRWRSEDEPLGLPDVATVPWSEQRG